MVVEVAVVVEAVIFGEVEVHLIWIGHSRLYGHAGNGY